MPPPWKILMHPNDIFPFCIMGHTFYTRHQKFIIRRVDGANCAVDVPMAWRSSIKKPTSNGAPPTVDVTNFMSYNYNGTNESCTNSNYDGSHDDLRSVMCKFMGKKYATMASTGYMGNVLLLWKLIEYEMKDASVIDASDYVVLSERENHRSIVNGLSAASRHLQFTKILFDRNHMNDPSLLLKIKSLNPVKVLVVCESLYSMGGDFMPMRELLNMKKILLMDNADTIESVKIYLDMAHSAGCVGEGCKGVPPGDVSSDDIDFPYITTTKSFSSMGCVVFSNDEDLHRHLENSCTTYEKRQLEMQMPMRKQLAGVVLNRLSREEDIVNSRSKVEEVSRHFKMLLEREGMRYKSSIDSPVVMIPLAQLSDMREVHKNLLLDGFLVSPACYPAVPLNEVYLRVCLSALHTPQQLVGFVESLKSHIKTQ